MAAVSTGNKVLLVGFDSFERQERQVRESHNPETGERMEISATVVLAF